MTALRLDFETRSAVDLEKVGAHVYAVDPTTDVWCAAYCFDDGPIRAWRMGEPIPLDIWEHVTTGGEVHAYNANFERLIWREVMGPRYGWPVPTIEQYHCTMAAAMAMSLPGGLDECAPALGLDIGKDMVGYRLMLQMCRPRKKDAGGIVWWYEPAKLDRLVEYCRTDVDVERRVAARVLPLSEKERQVWLLDQVINDRGVQIDRPLCEVMDRIVDELLVGFNKAMALATDYAVTACSQTAKLVKWLTAQGVPTDSVAKEALEELLVRDDLPEAARRALELRQWATKTSTAKIPQMLHRSVTDGRARGNLQYHGAGTGRWAARGIQLQNLPRPSFKKNAEVLQAIDIARAGGSKALNLVYGEKAMDAVVNCIRGLIVAGPDNVLMSADFSNIEGRVLAWLAGQEDKLDAFRAFDAGTGPDLYKVTAAGIYDVPLAEVDDKARQTGKVAELALGYQGGVGAFSKMAKVYRLKLADLYGTVYGTATSSNIDLAKSAYDQRGKGSGLGREAWLAAELVKLAWRQRYPKIVDFWADLETAALLAMEKEGETVWTGRIAYRKVGSFLWCRLPGGRVICYPYPRVELVEQPWGGTRRQIIYKAVDQYTRKWGDKKFYGGLAAENVTQAVARDVMVDAMLRVEAAGYPLVLTVHDELVGEPERDYGELREFTELMSVVPDWLKGCPIAVAGWSGDRYRKG